jgi:hypothetical protein
MTVEKKALLFLNDKHRKLSLSSRPGHIATALRSDYFWWAICLLCAGIYAWADRHAMNPDGMSYVDMASESLRSGPWNLINGYGSPLYPTLLSLAFAILRPCPSAEFPVVHLVNFLIFGVVLICFRFFWAMWLFLGLQIIFSSFFLSMLGISRETYIGDYELK